MDAEPYRQKFIEAMDDDFNTAQAIATLFDLARDINRADESGRDAGKAREALREMGGILGLTFTAPDKAPLDEGLQERVNKLIEERAAARKEKNWPLADEIRNQLDELGIALEDTPQGTIWKRKR